MNEKLVGYLKKFIGKKDFVGTKATMLRLEDAILYIGRRCEKEESSPAPPRVIKNEINVLVGARILKRHGEKGFRLTERRGKELYKSLKEETRE